MTDVQQKPELLSYGSVCSGIEAASVAWEPLGMQAAWLSEFDAFPSAVLAHRYPSVPNLGDMTAIPRKILTGDIVAPDVLVGGTPCQSFSMAGMREGLADDRGQLTIKYVETLDAIDAVRRRAGQPAGIAVWENVPGVLSDRENAFGCFLGALAGEDGELRPTGKRWSNAGCVYGPERAIAWRILDAQYFGVAQRRRRVFLVASARADVDPAAILFERESVRRDSAPSREARENAAGDVAPSLTASGRGVDRVGESRGQDPVVATPYQKVSHCLNAGGMGRIDYETESFVCQAVNGDLAHTLTASASKGNTEDGCGRGVPTIAVHGTQDPIHSEHCAHALGRNSGQENAVVCGIQNATRGKSQNGLGVAPPTEPMYTLDQGSQHGVCTQSDLAVRRLTPIECERLQGFPDGWTAVPFRGRDVAADGNRYKAIGNSMAVPVMRWIGQRIVEVTRERKT